MHTLKDGIEHEVTEQDLYNETVDALVQLVNAAEDVRGFALYGNIYALAPALDRLALALVQLRGPSHDPHNWAQVLNHHEPPNYYDHEPR